MILKQKITNQTNSVWIDEIEINLGETILSRIRKAMLIAQENEFLSDVNFIETCIMKQFSEGDEVGWTDISFFKYDYVEFKASRGGCKLKVSSKWSEGEFFEVELANSLFEL